MAGNRKLYRRATAKWEQLHRQENYSAPTGIGLTAVMVSLYSIEDKEHVQKEIDYFKEEAMEISLALHSQDQASRRFHGVNPDTLENVFQDPRYSDVVLIGHGDFSGVYTDDGRKFDWYALSLITNHLKRGRITQRFCGNTIRSTSVPFGAFAITDHRNIFAPAGKSFYPEYYPKDEELITSICDKPQLTYDDVKQMFPCRMREE